MENKIVKRINKDLTWILKNPNVGMAY